MHSRYIAPPEGLSEERSPDEVTWSHAVYLAPQDVWKAFGSKRPLREPSGAGAMQPNPYEAAVLATARFALVACALAVGLYAFFLARANHRVVLEQSVRYQPGQVLGDAPDATLPPPVPGNPNATSVAFLGPFELSTSGRNLEVALDSDVANSWAWVAGALINESTGEVTEFDLESSYYEGQDSDGRWVENERRASTFLSGLPEGRYVLRTEAQWPQAARPPHVRLVLTSGVARTWHFFLVLVALATFPLLVVARRSAFEQRRWEESTEEG